MVSEQEKKVAAKVVMAKKEEPSWVPDPVTGYYRPEDKNREIDAVDMRKILLSDYYCKDENVNKTNNMDQ